MSEDGATENPPGESLWNARQRRALDSCCSVLRQLCPPYSTPAHCCFLASHKLQVLHFWSFFKQCCSFCLNGVLIALHLTFAQNSYCGCEFCIFLYSIVCNKSSIWPCGTERVQTVDFEPKTTMVPLLLLASHPLLPCIKVL